jgi:hypothetical protein
MNQDHTIFGPNSTRFPQNDCAFLFLASSALCHQQLCENPLRRNKPHPRLIPQIQVFSYCPFSQTASTATVAQTANQKRSIYQPIKDPRLAGWCGQIVDRVVWLWSGIISGGQLSRGQGSCMQTTEYRYRTSGLHVWNCWQISGLIVSTTIPWHYIYHGSSLKYCQTIV